MHLKLGDIIIALLKKDLIIIKLKKKSIKKGISKKRNAL